MSGVPGYYDRLWGDQEAIRSKVVAALVAWDPSKPVQELQQLPISFRSATDYVDAMLPLWAEELHEALRDASPVPEQHVQPWVVTVVRANDIPTRLLRVTLHYSRTQQDAFVSELTASNATPRKGARSRFPEVRSMVLIAASPAAISAVWRSPRFSNVDVGVATAAAVGSEDILSRGSHANESAGADKIASDQEAGRHIIAGYVARCAGTGVGVEIDVIVDSDGWARLCDSHPDVIAAAAADAAARDADRLRQAMRKREAAARRRAVTPSAAAANAVAPAKADVRGPISIDDDDDFLKAPVAALIDNGRAAAATVNTVADAAEVEPKRRRGRPRKTATAASADVPQKKRGRPRKSALSAPKEQPSKKRSSSSAADPSTTAALVVRAVSVGADAVGSSPASDGAVSSGSDNESGASNAPRNVNDDEPDHGDDSDDLANPLLAVVTTTTSSLTSSLTRAGDEAQNAPFTALETSQPHPTVSATSALAKEGRIAAQSLGVQRATGSIASATSSRIRGPGRFCIWGLCSVVSSFREAEALLSLHTLDSGLLGPILEPSTPPAPPHSVEDSASPARPARGGFMATLEPRYRPLFEPQDGNYRRLYLKAKFNASQQAAIDAAVRSAGITLVQGPPGSGKTHFMLGLLNTVHVIAYRYYHETLLGNVEEILRRAMSTPGEQSSSNSSGVAAVAMAGAENDKALAPLVGSAQQSDNGNVIDLVASDSTRTEVNDVRRASARAGIARPPVSSVVPTVETAVPLPILVPDASAMHNEAAAGGTQSAATRPGSSLVTVDAVTRAAAVASAAIAARARSGSITSTSATAAVPVGASSSLAELISSAGAIAAPTHGRTDAVALAANARRVTSTAPSSTHGVLRWLLNSANDVRECLDHAQPALALRPRILVTAPSNAAVDGIVMRIVRDGMRSGVASRPPTSDAAAAPTPLKLEIFRPAIVRVGDAATPDVRAAGVALEQLVDAVTCLNAADCANMAASLAAEREALLSEIAALRGGYQSDVLAIRARVQADVSARRISVPDGARAAAVAQESLFGRVASRLLAVVNLYERNRAATMRVSWVARSLPTIEGGQGGEIHSGAVRREVRNSILEAAEIVLTTTSSSAVATVEAFVQETSAAFDIVLIDEAAQAVEPSSLIPMRYGATQAVLVGDPQQLPATVLSRPAAAARYDRSLFARLVEGGHRVHLLDTQYRMHPAISAFPSAHFYGGRLHDAPTVLGHARYHPMHEARARRPLVVFDLCNARQATPQSSTSPCNPVEAAFVLRLIAGLHAWRAKDPHTGARVKFTGSLGVITFYRGQLDLLRRSVRARFLQPSDAEVSNAKVGARQVANNSEATNEGGTDVPAMPQVRLAFNVDINTVDAFQGQERDVVILSCVRTIDSDAPRNSNGSRIGFLADPRRMNVALTRAKYGCWVLGSAHALRSNTHWAALLDHATATGVLISVPAATPDAADATDVEAL